MYIKSIICISIINAYHKNILGRNFKELHLFINSTEIISLLSKQIFPTIEMYYMLALSTCGALLIQDLRYNLQHLFLTQGMLNLVKVLGLKKLFSEHNLQEISMDVTLHDYWLIIAMWITMKLHCIFSCNNNPF